MRQRIYSRRCFRHVVGVRTASHSGVHITLVLDVSLTSVFGVVADLALQSTGSYINDFLLG